MAEELEQEAPEPVKLTPREIAIAKGEDPDAVEETSEEAVTEDGREGAGATEGQKTEEPKAESWADDEARELAASYGLSAEELEGFGSKEAFQKAAVLLDRNLLKKPDEKAEEKVEPEEKAEDDLDLEKLKEKFDEDTIDLVRRLKDRIERERGEVEKLRPVLETIQKERDEERANYVMSVFHSSMDQEDEELFGRAEDKDGNRLSLKKEHDDARGRVFNTAQSLARVLSEQAQRDGKPMPSYRAILQRAKQLEFGEQLAKRETEKRQADLKKQSKTRRPAARAKPVQQVGATGEDPHSAKAILSHPEMQKFLKDADEEAGRR